MGFNDWLPDFKGALVGFYDERLKETIENKSLEYKTMLQEHLEHSKKTQKVLVVIALAILFLVAIYCLGRN